MDQCLLQVEIKGAENGTGTRNLAPGVNVPGKISALGCEGFQSGQEQIVITQEGWQEINI